MLPPRRCKGVDQAGASVALSIRQRSIVRAGQQKCCRIALAAVAGIWGMRWCPPYPGRSNPASCDWRMRPCLQRQWPDRWNILLPRRQSSRVLPDEKWGSSRVRSGWVGKKLYESMQGRLARFFDWLEANPAATLEFVMNYR